MVEREIMVAATAPVNGRSPSEIGIEITKDGTIKFDAEKFAKALADDPAHVETALQTIAGRVDAAAVNASDKYEGLITSKIKGQESLVSSLNDQILNWDKRLAGREAALKKVYSSLEVMMSNMNSQMSWLSSQLAALPSSAPSNK
jgi:flagellar hook-associated protein 2